MRALDELGRRTMVGTIVVICFLPVIWLVTAAAFDHKAQGVGSLTTPFWGAVGRTLKQVGLACVISILIAWPMGTLAGLIKIPFHRLLMSILVVPLFTPNFLWAIGLSGFRACLPYRWQWFCDGFSGAVWSSITQVLPIVFLTTFIATRRIPRAQRMSALMAGGGGQLFRSASGSTFTFAIMSSVVAGVMVMSDPGIGQIMGYHGIASEFLIAVAARHNYQEAAIKLLAMCLVLLPIIAWAVWISGGISGTGFLKKSLSKGALLNLGLKGWFISTILLIFLLTLLGPPIAGLLRPLLHGGLAQTNGIAWEMLQQTWGTTLRYMILSSFIATSLGLFWAASCNRSIFLARGSMMVAIVLLAVPNPLNSLGFARFVSDCFASLDPVLRGDCGMAISMGLRFAPLAACFYINALNQRAATQDLVALIHGVPRATYLARVVIPQVLPTTLALILVIALLTQADVSSALILQPPGEATLATRLFSILDNASERVIAALSLGFICIGTTGVWLMLGANAFFKRLAGRPDATHA